MNALTLAYRFAAWQPTRDIPRVTKLRLLRVESRLEKLLRAYFARQAAQAMPIFHERLRGADPLAAAESNEVQLARAAIEMVATASELAQIQGLLEEAGNLGFQSIASRMALDASSGAFTLVNRQAVEILRDRANLIISSVDETTVNRIGRSLARGLEQGEHLDALEKRVARQLGDGGWRARMTAQTETMNSYSLASEETSTRLGIQRMQWVAGYTDVCPICVDLDGTIKELPHGTYRGASHERVRPPAHPACRCAQDPFFDDEELPEPKDLVPEPDPNRPTPRDMSDMSDEDIAQWADDQGYEYTMSESWNRRGVLTSEENFAMREYVGKAGYQKINGGLRHGDLSKAAHQRFVRKMDSGLLKTPTTEDLRVYRGIRGPIFDDLQPGDLVLDKGYTSTTFKREFADSWTLRDGQAQTLMEIQVPKGTPSSYLSLSKSSTGNVTSDRAAELLLPRDSTMRVVGTRKEGGRTILEMEWIP